MVQIRLIIFAVFSLLIFVPIAHAADDASISTTLSATEISELTTARNIKLEFLSSDDERINDLWGRIRSGFAMRELKDPLITKHEKWYASRPEYMARMTNRARRYLYYITREVERRGMPSEIALLPMIESAFKPTAYSRSRASGLWQFIPSTGKYFGLQQNWWYDERRDVISATNSALDYLQKLHGIFNDWELALVAYNWGEGSVQRAQARNRKKGLPTDYTSLRKPSEPRNYIPKLLAIKNIIANPEKFGLVLQDIPNLPYFAAVRTADHMDVKLAAELANISMEEFTALNPAHNRPVILQDNSDLILLPIGKVEAFLNNLASHKEPLVNWKAYQPKKGERLDRLATRFGLSATNFKLINGLSKRAKTSSGQILLVPSNAESHVGFSAFNMHLIPEESAPSIRHTVRRGDTLGGIARRYRVTVSKLKKWNKGLRNLIRPGQRITVLNPYIRKKPIRLS